MTSECRRTGEVEGAVHSGEWPSDLVTHLGGCETCRDARTALGFLSRLAAADAGAPPSPAGVVFLRAQVLDRLRRETLALDDAGTPLRIAGAAAGAFALGILALASGWASLQAPAPLVPWVSSAFAVLLAAAALLVVRWWGSYEG